MSQERLSVKERLTALENRKPEAGPRGERGPAGNIDAAVSNAEQTARQIVGEALDEIKKTLTELKNASRLDAINSAIQANGQRNAAALKSHDEKISQHLADLQRNLEDEVAAIVVKLFEEYGLLKLADSHVCGKRGKS